MIKKTYDEVTMKLGCGIWNLQHNFNLSGLTSKRLQSIDVCHASQSFINKQCALNIFEWETAVAELNFAPLCQIP